MGRAESPGASDPTVVLTEAERETLRTALEMGYFEVPRATTIIEIADELDRSDVDVSQRLRSGMGAVLRETELLESSQSRL
jgi:predicted DNA binding protein